jgi:phosphatidylglycerol:prolipoprotein diacylglycerol transferase
VTVDVLFLAGLLDVCLIAAGLAWVVYAWWSRVDYRRALVVLLALFAIHLLARQAALYIDRPGSNLPSDYSVFSLAILLGALLGLGVSQVYAPRAGLARSDVLDAAVPVLILGGVGARIYYLALHWDYYGDRSADLWNLAKGGMGLGGGLLFGLFALALFARLRRLSFWRLADAGALGLALAQAVGWLGAGLIGANYGVVSEARWAPELPDLYGLVQPRIPVQALAALFYFVLFCVLARMAWRTRPTGGTLCLIFLIVSAAGLFTLGFVRGDETAMWRGWRIDQWTDLLLLGAGLVILGMKSIRTSSGPRVKGRVERRELS